MSQMSQLSSKFSNLKLSEDEEYIDCKYLMDIPDGPLILQNKLNSASSQQIIQTVIHYTFNLFGLLKYKAKTEKIKDMKFVQLANYDWFNQKEFFDFLEANDTQDLQRFLEQKYNEGVTHHAILTILRRVTQSIAQNFIEPIMQFYKYISSLQIRQFRQGAASLIATFANCLNRLIEEHSSGKQSNFLAVKQCTAFLEKILDQFVMPFTDDTGAEIRNYGIDILVDPLSYLSIITKETSYYRLFGQILAKNYIEHLYLSQKLMRVLDSVGQENEIILYNKKPMVKGQLIRENLTTLVNAQLDGLLNLFMFGLKKFENKQDIQKIIKFGLANNQDQPKFDREQVNQSLKSIMTQPDLNITILLGEILDLIDDRIEYSKQPYFQDIVKLVQFQDSLFGRNLDYEAVLSSTLTVILQMPSLLEPQCYLDALMDQKLVFQQQICLIYTAAAVLECQELLNLHKDHNKIQGLQYPDFENIHDRFAQEIFIDSRKLLQITIPYLYLIKNIPINLLKDSSHLVVILFERLLQQIELISIDATKILCRSVKRLIKDDAYEEVCQNIISKYLRSLSNDELIEEVRITTGGAELLKAELINVVDLHKQKTIDLIIDKYNQIHIMSLFSQIIVNIATTGYLADNNEIMEVFSVQTVQKYLQIYFNSNAKISNNNIEISMFMDEIKVAYTYNIDLVQDQCPYLLFNEDLIEKFEQQLIKFLEKYMNNDISPESIRLLKEVEILLKFCSHLASSTFALAAANYLINFLIMNKFSQGVDGLLQVIFFQAHQKFVNGMYDVTQSFQFYIELISMIHKDQERFIQIVVDYQQRCINVQNDDINDLIAEKLFDFLNEQLYQPRRQQKEDTIKFLSKLISAPKIKTIIANYTNPHDMFDKLLTDETLSFDKSSKSENYKQKESWCSKAQKNKLVPQHTSQQYFYQAEKKKQQQDHDSSDQSEKKIISNGRRRRNKTPNKKVSKQNTQQQQEVYENQNNLNIEEQVQSVSPSPQQKFKWGQQDQQESRIEKTEGKKFQKKQYKVDDEDSDGVGPKQRKK
ncbi:hypothetical protein pb186bvf_006491 [Paramecium bursaria]